MQASLLSSDHGSCIFKLEGVVCSQRAPFKPVKSHLKYNYTFTSCTSLSATLDAPYRQHLISPTTTLTWRRRNNNGRFVPPLLSGNPSSGLSANDDIVHSSGSRSFRGWVEVVGVIVSTAFPIWLALGYFLGFGIPNPIWVALRYFLGFGSPNSYNLLEPKWSKMVVAFTMLGMGMTLTFDDLKGALAMRKELFVGFFLQHSVMPLSAFYIIKILNLPSHCAAGLILVGCCPGGISSNIMTYIARGNVSLSILMTAAGTVPPMVMIPLLSAKLAARHVAVDGIGLLKSTLQVVLLPVLVGAFMNQYCKGVVRVVSPLMPPIALATIGLLCGIVISQSLFVMLMSAEAVVAIVFLHTSGFIFGYTLSRLLGLDVSSSRTISIQIGMQNSAIGVILALQYLWNPWIAASCVVSNICHLFLGSALAAIWRQHMPQT